MKRASFVVLAGCLDIAPSYQLPTTNLATATELAPFELRNAMDVIDDGCAPTGARDVMFELFTPITQTYVIDTGGSTTMDVAFSIHDGACPGTLEPLACSSSTTVPPTKRCDSATYNDLVMLLPGPHAYCLVVSEAAPGSEGSIALRVFAGGLPAAPLYANGAPIDGDTCSGPMLPSLDCVSPDGDRTAATSVVVVCPGNDRLTGSIVPDAMLTPAFSVHARLPDGPQLTCSAGAAPGATLPIDLASLPAATPLWFLVERATSTCGSFRISLAN